MKFKRMTELDLRGKRVFIRADLNVPQDDAGAITDDTRIRASVPCIRHALDAGAAVMVTSHLGRPTEGQFKPEDSLAPIAKRLAELLGQPVALKANWVDGVEVKSGEVVEVPVSLLAERDSIKKRSMPIQFHAQAEGNPKLKVTEDARFLGPVD